MKTNDFLKSEYYFRGRIMDYTGDCVKHISTIPNNIPYAVCQCATGLTFGYSNSSITTSRIIPQFSFSEGITNGIRKLSHKHMPISISNFKSKSDKKALLYSLQNLKKSCSFLIGPFLSSKFEDEFLSEYEIFPNQYLICTYFNQNTGVFFHPNGTMHTLSFEELFVLLDVTNNNVNNYITFMNPQDENINCSISNVSLDIIISGGSILSENETSQHLEILTSFFNTSDKVVDLISFNYDLSRMIIDLLCIKEVGEYAISSEKNDNITRVLIKKVLKCISDLIYSLSIIRAKKTKLHYLEINKNLELWDSYINSITNIYKYTVGNLSL